VVCLTPYFSCKHTITVAAKPHPKIAWQLQRLLDRVRSPTIRHLTSLYETDSAITQRQSSYVDRLRKCLSDYAVGSRRPGINDHCDSVIRGLGCPG
jgi:hypothetical protein